MYKNTKLDIMSLHANCRDAVVALQQIDDKNDISQFLGSAFCYRDNSHFLTAAHCVAGIDPRTIYFYSPLDSALMCMVDVCVHPTADIAILKTQHRSESKLKCLTNVIHGDPFGLDIAAFGYPEDVKFEIDPKPTPRLFKGHIQRSFMHDSHLDYKYAANELSFQCPPGLSGGPVYAPEYDNVLLGVVSENLEVSTFRDSFEEIDEDGTKTIYNNMRITRYGVSVNLAMEGDWLVQNTQ